MAEPCCSIGICRSIRGSVFRYSAQWKRLCRADTDCKRIVFVIALQGLFADRDGWPVCRLSNSSESHRSPDGRRSRDSFLLRLWQRTDSPFANLRRITSGDLFCADRRPLDATGTVSGSRPVLVPVRRCPLWPAIRPAARSGPTSGRVTYTEATCAGARTGLRGGRVVRVGVIGCGYWGSKHVRVPQQIPAVSGVVVVDPRTDRLAEVAQSASTVTVFDDLGRPCPTWTPWWWRYHRGSTTGSPSGRSPPASTFWWRSR